MAEVQRPFPRLQECGECNADLHVCRMCRYYNTRLISKCEHDHAEPPRDREAANFCQYFHPNPYAYTGHDVFVEERARSQLDELFGESENELLDEVLEHDEETVKPPVNPDKTAQALSELDKLFKK